MAECVRCGATTTGTRCRACEMSRRRLMAGVETDDALLAQREEGATLAELGRRFGFSKQKAHWRLARARERRDSLRGRTT